MSKQSDGSGPDRQEVREGDDLGAALLRRAAAQGRALAFVFG